MRERSARAFPGASEGDDLFLGGVEGLSAADSDALQ
jgi:hypothetical protein